VMAPARIAAVLALARLVTAPVLGALILPGRVAGISIATFGLPITYRMNGRSACACSAGCRTRS
jgi:hypothetical protein